MQYEDSIERSAEYLRLALPLMSRQAAALHPVSYAVWYAYVKQADPALRAAVDQLIDRHGRLTEASTQALFGQHVAALDPQVAQRVAEGIHTLMDSMAQSAASTGEQGTRFASSLTQLSNALDGGGTPERPLVRQVLADTQAMQSAVGTLQSQLAQSQREIDALRDEVRRAGDQALVDSLTGLANRRAFEQQLDACVGAARPEGAAPDVAPCLLVGDIDHFKKLNTDFGHAFGDQVLRSVAKILDACKPAGGFAARIGGEEFALLLPPMPLAEAQGLAEHIRTTIAASRVRRQGEDQTLARVTVSLGVAHHRPGEAAETFLSRADRAVAVSKHTGRNKVTAVSG
jgi:diguanylate cyclase